MATSGNIQTLFKNREQTEAIFPRTKVRAVTDDDGNRLDVILEDVVHIGDKVIDTSSIPINADSLGSIPAEDYATEAWVKNEIANVQAGGEVDLSGFASKDDITLLNKRINELDYPVDSVNEKTGAVVLNAEDVGAHPNTWMPTAEQVGARPDTWMPTAEQVGAAPAGYIEGTVTVQTDSDIDNALLTWFNAMPNQSKREFTLDVAWRTSTAILPHGTWFVTINKSSGNDGGYGVIEAFSENTDGSKYTKVARIMSRGVLGPLEWENPPMETGVAYRTTERAFGKAIYKRVNEYGEIGFRLEGSQQEKDDTWEYGPIGGAIYGPFRHHGYFYIDNNEVLQLGYIDPLKTTNGEFASMVLLLSSNFYGNMHGSSHIVHIRADDSGSDGNMNIAVSVGMNTTYNSPRTFYYKYDADAGRLYLYVLASGGNGFGRWNVTALQDSGNIRWNPEFVESPSLDGLIEVN